MPDGQSQGENHKLMTVKEAATALRVSPRVVYQGLNRGELPGRKIGGAWRLYRRQIAAMVEPEVSDAFLAPSGMGDE